MRYSVSHAARLMIQQLCYKQKETICWFWLVKMGSIVVFKIKKYMNQYGGGKERGIQRNVNCISDNIVLMRLTCSPKIMASVEWRDELIQPRNITPPATENRNVNTSVHRHALIMFHHKPSTGMDRSHWEQSHNPATIIIRVTGYVTCGTTRMSCPQPHTTIMSRQTAHKATNEFHWLPQTQSFSAVDV